MGFNSAFKGLMSRRIVYIVNTAVWELKLLGSHVPSLLGIHFVHFKCKMAHEVKKSETESCDARLSVCSNETGFLARHPHSG